LRHPWIKRGNGGLASVVCALALVALTLWCARALSASAEVELSPPRAAEAETAVPCTASALPTLGGRSGNAVAVSSTGTVVGIADDKSGVSRPVIWRGGKITALEVPFESAVPTSINGQGIVVGTGYDSAAQMLVGWWWSKGTTHRLPVQRDDIALPEAIDESGHVAGALIAGEDHSDGPGADEDERAAFWPSVRALPRELAARPGDRSSHAFAIAPDGTVGGVSLGSGGTAVLWDRQGDVHGLNSLGGRGGIVRGFTGTSDPVGQAAVSTGGTHAVTWDDSGRADDLGTLGRDKSSTAIAATSDLVVGSGDASVRGSVPQAVAWIAGAPQVLPPATTSQFRGEAGTANAVAQNARATLVVGFSADAVGVRQPTTWSCLP
jgi:hypothetical protein